MSFNYGMGDQKRVKQGIFYGIFAMSGETEALCVMASRIIAAGFLFAGGNCKDGKCGFYDMVGVPHCGACGFCGGGFAYDPGRQKDCKPNGGLETHRQM